MRSERLNDNTIIEELMIKYEESSTFSAIDIFCDAKDDYWNEAVLQVAV